MANESSQQVEMIGPTGYIKKHELVRLIIQCLYSLGFNSSASQLEQESNVSHKCSQFTELESLIMEGKWQECIQFLAEEIKDHIKSEKIRVQVLGIILGQCILECASSGNFASGLRFLQRDYSEFGVEKKKLDHLGMDMLFRDDRMRELSAMRREVVHDLEIRLPPSLVVDERRLEKLLEMCLYSQMASCKYHNRRDMISLYQDHYCNEDNIPSETLQVPDQGNLTVKHTLRGHQNPVSFLSWSPNDAMLVTCGTEILKLWNVETGVCRFSFRANVPILSSCAWFPDSTIIVFGTCGPRKCINRFKINERRLTRWVRTNKNTITDLAITPDGDNFICVYFQGYSSYITIWNHRKYTKFVISEMVPITSVCVSRDSCWLLANLTGNEIHLWSVVGTLTDPHKRLHRKQFKFVIHSCFGLDSRFFASGSEDSQIYIWNYLSPEPIKVLTGHSMVVNCVSWNLPRPEMLASASDDRTIRIWIAATHINN